MKRFGKVTKLLLLFSAALALFVLAGCGNQSSSDKTVKIGIMASDDRIWKPLAKKLKKQGIDLKLVEFTDYNTPNKALTQGEVDINAFQNYHFMNDWNKANKGNIVSIGDTYIAPQRIYSKSIKSVKELKDGAKVAIPSDSTNEDRGLRVLEQAGLIKLKKASLHTTKDITENKKNLKITPLDAAQTAHSLSDVSMAVVNNDIAEDSGLKPSSAIYVEKITKASKPYVNFIATTKDKKNNATYKKVVKAYQTKFIENKLKEIYKGSTLPAWNYKF
ncbi:MetQ/NlpA family ABC transporter substrate-binding protein [Companilactobacillus mishanensis]|uniref:Lipoprotein n=1 Tax=Companilactobacillus mishanensis TaxID=2486008 RepID=A0A5P0ZG56_9LACO|nr:MetQ/NlpA family ABC transporter substrate-binding protein [Companilactobacillus mishanensis]MQS52024.1 MetQ/NlpA family ABC transporter substrate-binding protein [Companilactobacillus mishanensis]MQS88852.1 MetQ/NlpA family ABC transporter substrate-binding protein [Companilactobacillus mishanensis]